MKVGKAMKKLKFWSRKKKKKKTNTTTPDYHPPQPTPPCTCHYCHSWLPVQPSAPPLPPWFDYDQTHNFLPSTTPSSSQSELFHQDIIAPELGSSSLDSTMPASSTTSYQQYMVPNPVYGLPIAASRREQHQHEEDSGVFGCVLTVGRHLIRCFFPCFRIISRKSDFQKINVQ